MEINKKILSWFESSHINNLISRISSSINLILRKNKLNKFSLFLKTRHMNSHFYNWIYCKEIKKKNIFSNSKILISNKTK